ncbi:MAG: hypothetical protein QM607_03050 [Microbacterium sp.]
MGFFSRKKKTEAAAHEEPAATADTNAPQDDVAPDQAEDVTSVQETPEAPEVNISFTAYRGVGAQSGPEVSSPTEEMPQAETPEVVPAVKEGTPPRKPQLPLAPAAPPTDFESVPGVRDNALLRDALANLPEKPTGPQVMGVLRQLLQGHAFLRVKGDARAQIAEGKPVSFGIARLRDENYLIAFSSGRALQDAVKADGDTSTSAVAQPVGALLKQVVEGDFGGIIIDNASAPHRVVLPKKIIEQAWTQADKDFRVKNALTAERAADTPHRVAAILAGEPPLWVAVGKNKDDDKPGVVEARLADGTRLVQVHSHPLEVVVQGRGEKALPLSVANLGKLLRDNPGVAGVLIDPAGPLMTLTREELAPVIALAE